MRRISQDNLARFAGLVAQTWNDPQLRQDYLADPVAVLARHGIQLPAGIPTPQIPPPPVGGIAMAGEAFRYMTFDDWDATVQQLPGATPAGGPQAAIGPQIPGGSGPPTALKIVSLACVACPYSCFSSISE